jgi:hypothetical protein
MRQRISGGDQAVDGSADGETRTVLLERGPRPERGVDYLRDSSCSFASRRRGGGGGAHEVHSASRQAQGSGARRSRLSVLRRVA